MEKRDAVGLINVSNHWLFNESEGSSFTLNIEYSLSNWGASFIFSEFLGICYNTSYSSGWYVFVENMVQNHIKLYLRMIELNWKPLILSCIYTFNPFLFSSISTGTSSKHYTAYYTRIAYWISNSRSPWWFHYVMEFKIDQR